MNIESIENELIEAAIILSGIAESNSPYTCYLAIQIEKTGKAVGKLTIDELIALHTDCTKNFNISPNDPPTLDSGNGETISLDEELS